MPIIDARQYKTLLICPSKPMAVELASMLAHGLPLAPVHDVNMYPSRRQIMELVRAFEPALCFLDVTSATPVAFQALDDLHTVAPTVPVIAVLASNNTELVLQCLRRGAKDFLIQPFTTDQIDTCLEKVARMLPAPDSKGAVGGKVIAVLPAKGGAGATTIACNLAHQCKRLGSKRTLLADMDALTGTVSFVLKLKSSYSFMDVLQRQTALDPDLWKQMVLPAHGIDVLLAPETIVDPITDLPSAATILDFAQNLYDAAVMDCGSPYGNWNLSIARTADEILLVSTTDLVSLQAAQRAIAYLDHQRVDTGRVKLVISRYTKDGGMQMERIGQALDIEVFQTIPNDADAVQKSLLEGKPIAANTTIGKAFASLADRLVDLKGTKKSAAKAGLFSSIFK